MTVSRVSRFQGLKEVTVEIPPITHVHYSSSVVLHIPDPQLRQCSISADG